MLIYFGASIRGGRDDVGLYMELIEHLKKYGEVLSEHIGDSSITSAGEIRYSDRELHDRDVGLLFCADVAVMEVTTPSTGVGFEIGKAAGKKPVLCLYRPMPDRRLSAMIAGNPNLTVAHYENAEAAKSLIDEFFKKIEKSQNVRPQDID